MLQDFLGQYGIELGAISIGTIALMVWRIAVFFKKDKYVLPFLNSAVAKANKALGEENVSAFLHIAKDVKVKDIPVAIKEFADKQLKIENMLSVLLSNQLALGVYDNNPEIKELAEKLIE